MAKAYGTRARRWRADARSLDDLGTHFGHGLTAAEVDYLVAVEWARTPDDVLCPPPSWGLPSTPIRPRTPPPLWPRHHDPAPEPRSPRRHPPQPHPPLPPPPPAPPPPPPPPHPAHTPPPPA